MGWSRPQSMSKSSLLLEQLQTCPKLRSMFAAEKLLAGWITKGPKAACPDLSDHKRQRVTLIHQFRWIDGVINTPRKTKDLNGGQSLGMEVCRKMAKGRCFGSPSVTESMLVQETESQAAKRKVVLCPKKRLKVILLVFPAYTDPLTFDPSGIHFSVTRPDFAFNFDLRWGSKNGQVCFLWPKQGQGHWFVCHIPRQWTWSFQRGWFICHSTKKYHKQDVEKSENMFFSGTVTLLNTKAQVCRWLGIWFLNFHMDIEISETMQLCQIFKTMV